MYKSIIRPILFLFDPEVIHNFTFSFLRFIHRIPGVSLIIRTLYCFESPILHRNVFGLDFKNPVGLAAGFDKDARLVDPLSDFGFGFIEIGTVTPVAQRGNPKPRLFRLAQDHSLINRMGFNNKGVVAAAELLKKRQSKILVGGNIGKNKDTPNDQAKNDFGFCFEELYEVVDYFVVNVSSPNTPGLRDLQDKEPLKDLLSDLITKNKARGSSKPILLKIAPDLSDAQIDDIIDIVQDLGIDGLIATNTTVERRNLSTPTIKLDEIGTGGLSGGGISRRSTEVIRYIFKKTKGRVPIIGVGGILSAEDAIEKLDAGASLVQIYAGFVYEGPAFVKKINQEIIKRDLKFNDGTVVI